MRRQMKMPRRGGSPEAASKTNFRFQVYTIKRLLQLAAVALLPFVDSLAFAVTLALAVFAVGGGR